MIFLQFLFFSFINHFHCVWKREREMRHFPISVTFLIFKREDHDDRWGAAIETSFTRGQRLTTIVLSGASGWSLRDHPVYLTTFSLHAEKSEPTCHRKEKGGHPNVSPAWRCLDTSRLTNTRYYTYCPTLDR